VFGIPTAAVAAVMVFVVASASGVLSGSPSKFESGDDPTLGLGNMTVDTSGNKDWVSVTGEAAYAHITDKSDSTDDSYVSGQKQDTVCPEIDPAHSNPPKDDFTDIASFTETAANGDTYLYGATIRVAPNGSASENIELKQGTAGNCPGSSLLARVAGDKMLTIDYNGGGKAPFFNVLTWVETGACFVANDVAPCWGASVLSLSSAGAEGGVNGSDITAANNPISGAALKAGRFAEFGVNLATAGILPAGTCKAFPQSIWGSRSSGSSFVSTTKDISIENKTISNCGEIKIIKRTIVRGLNQNFSFTSTITTATAGAELSCTGDSTPASFTLNDTGNSSSDSAANTEDCTKVHSGTYTVTEGADPNGFVFKNFSCTASTGSSTTPASSTTQKNVSITLAADGLVTCVYTNEQQLGAIKLTKTSVKGASTVLQGAHFQVCTNDGPYTAQSPCVPAKTGSGDLVTGADGTTCVDGLGFGDYYVTEKTAPTGYAIDDTTTTKVTIDNNAKCNDTTYVGEAKTYTDTPLTDIVAKAKSQATGGTKSRVTCVDSSSANIGNSPQPSASTFADPAEVDANGLAPGTYTCTIIIDP
jgi:hypothetical protein